MSTRTSRIRRRGTTTALIGSLTALVLLVGTSVPAPVLAENTGFWYGADSGGPGPANGSPPYQEPSCGSGHSYGGYIGKIGGADLVSSSNPDGYGPGFTGAWNSTDASDANADHFNYSAGVGTGGFWFMYGPGDTDGTGDSPTAWGQQQGKWALADWQRWYDGGTHRMPFQILWMDVEGPGSYGWGSNGASNRDVFNGFWDYVTNAKEGPVPGVYSTNYQWGVIMSGHTSIASTWEWTAQVSVENSPSPCPVDFSESSSFYADFFGGQNESSAHTAMWQWSQGNADYDQIDSNKSLPD
jgi:hypothetical protein